MKQDEVLETVEAVENPEWTQYRIQEEIKAKVELEKQLAEMNKQIEYSEKIELRNLKKKAFELALSIKPQGYSDGFGTPNALKAYNVDKLILDANKIYSELIK